MNKARTYLLHLLIFSIPFQKWQPFGSVYANITFLLFFVYFFFSLLSWKQSFRLGTVKEYIIPLLLLWGLMIIMTSINYYSTSKNAYSEVRQLFMVIVFFILIINAIRQQPYLEKSILNTFLWSTLLLAFFYFLGIGIDVEKGRTTLFNINANNFSFWFVISIFIMVKFFFENEVGRNVKFIYLLTIPAFAFIIANSGSRASFGVLMFGVVTYLFLNPIKYKNKRIITIAALACVVVGGYFIFSAQIMQQRILDQLNDPTFGGRKSIWELTKKYISENPYFGGGASGFEFYISQYMGKAWSPHNEYLLITAYTGIVGLFAFLLFLFRIGRISMFALKERKTAFYSVLFLTLIIFFYFSGGFLTTFTPWFLLALVGSNITYKENIA